VDLDHIVWKSWKLISRSINPTYSLFVAQRPSPLGIPLLPREHGEILGRDGVGKSCVLEHKRGVSLKRVKIEEKLLQMAHRKSQTLFRTEPYHYLRNG